MQHDGPHWLKRSVQPYIALPGIASAVTLFSFYVSVRTGEWDLIASMALIWLLVGYLTWLNLRYRVSFDEQGLQQQASGGPDIYIPYDRLERVSAEVAVDASRPFRRIAFYAIDGRWIDVSLRHFLLPEVNELLTQVQRRRPDLSLPKLPSRR